MEKLLRWKKIELSKKVPKQINYKYLIFEPKNENELRATRELIEKNNLLRVCLVLLNIDCIRYLNTFPETFRSIKKLIIYYPLKDDSLSNNDSFEISSFLSKIANKEINKSNYLGDFYNKKSYEILLNQKGISQNIKKYMLEEINLIKFSNKHKLNSLDLEIKAIVNKKISKNIYKFLNYHISHKILRKIKIYSFKVTCLIRNLFYKIDSSIIKEYKKKSTHPKNWKNILITGWYGTETTGDKAILGEIINRFKIYNPEVSINISTIDLRLSWQTRIEMNLDVKFIKITEIRKSIRNSRYDSLIFGGGPIMYTRFLQEISESFKYSQFKKMNTIIYGCGIGPIKNKQTENIIKNILLNTDIAIFRDEESNALALKLGLESNKAYIGCDPALKYIKDICINFKDLGKNRTISFLLREPTQEYKFDKLESFTEEIELIRNIFFTYFGDYIALPISMHMYWRGKDDRNINNFIVRQLNNSDDYNSYKYKDIFSIIKEINNSELTISMRYHAHLFCLGLGVPFLSIDYTGKSGKINNLLKSINMERFIFRNDLFSKKIIEELLSEEHTNKLIKKRDLLVNKLIDCYDKIWET